MPELDATLTAVVADRYFANLARVRELAAPLTEKQFWTKPYPYGNSFGHLVLHLTGNLNYYIGAQIANTGYVRDRAREFTEPNPPSPSRTGRGPGDRRSPRCSWPSGTSSLARMRPGSIRSGTS